MRIDDLLRDTIVAIGVVGRGGDFIPYGTGFVVLNTIDGWQAFQNIVTARHVVEGIKNLHIRVNTKNGDAHFIPADIWHYHPDKRVDCAISPSILDKELFPVRMYEIGSTIILTPEKIREFEIGIGDDVFAVGMFMQCLGELRNLPIVRGGIISAMPEEEIETEYGRHHAYLVETRSFDGLSGSPVFAHLAPLRPLYGPGTSGGRKPRITPSKYSHFLMGMLLGHHLAINAKDEVAILPERDDEAQRVRMNTGIGIVLPFSYIAETIEQPEVKELRMAAQKEKIRSSYHSTAAAPQVKRPEDQTRTCVSGCAGWSGCICFQNGG